MYFNRKNAEQKNWRMIKKGKHFLFGCSLVFAVGATLVAPSVKADTVEAKPETSSTTEGTKPVSAEENPTYAAPAVEVAPVVATEENAEKAVETTQNSKEEPVVATEKAKEAESIQAPEVTVVYNPSALTDEEKAKVVAAVKAANPTATDVQVQADGSVVVTFADGSSANLTATQTIKDGSLVAKPRKARAASRSIDGSLGTGEFTGEGVKQFESVRYSVDGDKTTWTIEVVPEKASNTFAGLAVTSDDTISSIRMIGKSGKFGNNLKDQYLDLPKRPDNMPFANYKVHMSEFRTIGGGIPDNIVYEVVTNGKNHNLFGRFATALVESSLKNNGLNGKSVIGARTSDFPTVGVSLKSKLPAETPKPQPQPEPSKPVAPAGQAPEITSNLSGKASTPADVTVKAPAGSTVKLYNKDGVVIGEAVANDQGVATVHPTNSLPEGEITATSTPAGGTESAKSAPITVTKTPLTENGIVRTGTNSLQLLVSKSHVTVYPGDSVSIDVIGASSSEIQAFFASDFPKNLYGVYPEGNYFSNAGTVIHTKDVRNKFAGTVASNHPAGDYVTTFLLKNKKGQSTTNRIRITVLESAKKYEPTPGGVKVEVADPNNISATEKAAIEKAVGDANTALPQGTTYVADEKGNVTITYPDKSTDKISATYLVTPAKDTTAPDKPVVNTDLTGKAGTKTPVEVTAEKGSTVALYDKDGNKIGEATAGENGKATITPSVNIPAGAVTAKATDAAGNTSVASDPATATPAADTEAPAKPVVNTDLTGKAGTKTPVEVTAEKGSTVALYDKDNNKIGEATAGENGKATITPTVDIPAGAVTAKATDAAGNTSVASDPATATAPAAVVAPTVEIPYSNKDTKEVYVYAGEENSFDIKFKDDSGKIVSATVKQGGNREFGSVAGEENTINTQYGFKANVISTETPATADAPAVITYRGTPAATDGLKPEVLEAATKGENPAGMVLGWRYATATDADGAFIENRAVGSSNATDPGSFRVMLKAQSQKYDIATPTPAEKVVVADPSKVTDDDLAKIKEKLQLEYSKTNDDANLADQKGKAVADKDGKIQSVTKDADGNLVVTYKDGSQDKKPLSELVTKDTEAPAKPVVNTDLTGKAGTKTPVEVSAEPGSTVALYDKDGNKIGEATAGENGKATITPTVNIPAGNVTAKATDAAGNTSDASDPAKATTPSTPDTEAPAKPVVDTDLTGKAGTKTPVVVSAE
ncbi:Ig-like domain-containing protein, partial [Streptococcus infantis]|uniref:Ig-like domain-containing protein n=1 Tax=Streptococcus infantis TaxID=68892 RepID=UPI0039C3BE98